jgi:hypothetical protein
MPLRIQDSGFLLNDPDHAIISFTCLTTISFQNENTVFHQHAPWESLLCLERFHPAKLCDLRLICRAWIRISQRGSVSVF